MKLVSIVILNWNGKDLLEKCLSSIIELTAHPNYEIIVVDNGSKDHSQEMVKEKFPSVTLVENGKNLGFSKGTNIGIRNAKGKYLMLLNNDTVIIDRKWLNTLVEVAEWDGKIGIVTCKLIFPNGELQTGPACLRPWGNLWMRFYPKLCRFTLHTNSPADDVDIDYATGSAMLVKREVIEKVGMFDEAYSPAYYEDTDLGVRAKLAGYRIVYTPKTKIIHLGTKTAARHLSAKKHYFIHQKNAIRFLLLNYPLSWLLLSLPTYKRIAQDSIKNGNFGNLVRAWLANLQNLAEIWRKRQARMKKTAGFTQLFPCRNEKNG